MNAVEELLGTITIPKDGFTLKKQNIFYWGKSSVGDIVYGVESENDSLISLTQSTKYLKIHLNKSFDVYFDDKKENKRLSLIILKNEGIRFLKIFIRLTDAIDDKLSDDELLNFFLCLKELFSNEIKKSVKDLQGLYGELYTMTYLMDNYKIDISKFYQSEDKRKFDFSISEVKKVEVKTTTLPLRIHHFNLEQLNTLRYEIMVVSIMLQKDDSGLSLMNLVGKTKKLFSNNLKLLIHIENMIKNIDDDVLDSLKYNTRFLDENIKVVNAVDIPKIKEKTNEGVFNVEFDSDLSTVKHCTEIEIKKIIL